jgi:hypothetical protein
MDKYEYSYPREELEKLIDKLNKGMRPAVPDEMLLEANILLKEMENELFDDTDSSDAQELRRRADMMKKKIEEDRHKAHKDDIKIVKVGPKQKAKITKAVSTSLVRAHVSDYNKTDEQLYGDEERRAICEKLSNIKSIIRDQGDYMRAMKTIAEAIEYSLKHDYPGMKKSEVIDLWRNGEIKVNIPIPKLFSDYVHEITDVETLRAIATGEMTMMSKSELDSEIVKKDYSKSKLIDYEYDVISPDEYNTMVEMHRRGWDTPLSVIFNNRGKIYNQFTLSSSNMFSNMYGKMEIKQPEGFDWFQDNAAEKYLEKKRGINPFDSDLIASILHEKNDHKLSREFRDKLRYGANIRVSTTTNEGFVDADLLSSRRTIPEKDPRTLELEQSILKAIQDNN